MVAVRGAEVGDVRGVMVEIKDGGVGRDYN